MAQIIATNSSLTRLNLGSNNLQDGQGARIVHAMKTNTSIKNLSLRHSGSGSDFKLGAMTANALANTLLNNSTLKELNFWNHDVFKNTTALPILNALKNHNHTLMDIEGLTGHYEREIKSFLKRNACNSKESERVRANSFLPSP